MPMLCWLSVMSNAFWAQFCSHTSKWHSMANVNVPKPHLQKPSIYASRIMNKCCKTNKQKLVALYLGVVCYFVHADDLNTFPLICLSHAICDPNGLKQNGRYCWLYKIWTGNDCNFAHYEITLMVLYITK